METRGQRQNVEAERDWGPAMLAGGGVTTVRGDRYLGNLLAAPSHARGRAVHPLHYNS